MHTDRRILLLGIALVLSCLNFSGCKTIPKPQSKKTKNEPADKYILNLGSPIQKGVLFRTFDQKPERLHEGLSFGAPPQTPVLSGQNGEVIFAGKANNNLGLMVIIKHMDPFVTIYGHLEGIIVKVGQRVKKGERIATVGESGGVESPRVYFELRKERMPIDPELYL